MEETRQEALRRLCREQGLLAVENPWHRPRGPDLGRLFSRYGGGGHHDIGSVILDRDGVQPERVVQEVLRVIQAKDG